MQRKINLFASQRLVELLSNIEHQIAYTLNESIRYRNSFPISYLDFGTTNDTVSFIARNKYDDIQKNNGSDWNSRVWKDKRSEMKIGKLIRMFYLDHFPTNHPKDQPRPKPQIDIESFVNKFKAERDKDVNYDRFEIIEGKDFHHWYSQDNYSRFVHEETTLGRSCLRYNESSKFLHLFSKNPDTFKMLILKDDANRLRGRANLYTLEKPEGRIYMDRIYSVNDYDVELFKDYAKQNGWLHKEQQTYGWHNNIVDTRDGQIHKWDDMVMLAKLDKIPGSHFKYYPYLDTLSIFNPDNKTLTNDGRLRVLAPHLVLSDYQGQYHNEVDGNERVFSTVYNEYIIRDEAVFVEIDDTWVYENDSVYVHNSGGQHAYRNGNKIVESYIYKRKWFLKDDAEYSDYLGTYIHKESVRIAYLSDDKTQEVKIHYRMVGREFIEKDGVILKKKDNTNPKSSSKLLHKDLESLEQVIGRISGGSSSRGSLNDYGNLGIPLQYFDEPRPTNSYDDTESNEEDSDLLNGIDIDRYTDEVREYILETLSQRRNRNMRNQMTFHSSPQNQMGRPDEPQPERVRRITRRTLDDRPQVTDDRPVDSVRTPTWTARQGNTDGVNIDFEGVEEQQGDGSTGNTTFDVETSAGSNSYINWGNENRWWVEGSANTRLRVENIQDMYTNYGLFQVGDTEDDTQDDTPEDDES